MMPRKLPPHVDRNHVKGHTYLVLGLAKGGESDCRTIRRPLNSAMPTSAAMAGESAPQRIGPRQDQQGTVGALIASYMRSTQFIGLRTTSKKGYLTRLEQIRIDLGQRAVAGLTRERINTYMLLPFADRPGPALDTLKKLRILIRQLSKRDGWRTILRQASSARSRNQLGLGPMLSWQHMNGAGR